nr:tetratricopeptide repeat protein [Colwellia sp. E2M01]
MKNKKWQQANALFDTVIFNQPNLSGSYVNKAIIAQQQGDLAAAQTLLNTAIGINKLNLHAHHLQGQIYREQGKFVEAEQSYLAALDIWPDFSDAQLSMAILLELYRGRLIEAHGYYTSYLLLNSDDEEVKRWQAGLEIKITRAGLEVPVVEEPVLVDEVAIEPVEPEQVVEINTQSVNNSAVNDQQANDSSLNKAAEKANE